MKKKLLSLMVVMSLVVSMTLGVTGCGSKSSDSDKKVLKVTIGHRNHQRLVMASRQ